MSCLTLSTYEESLSASAIPPCQKKLITYFFLALHFVLFWSTNISRSKYRVFAPVYQNSLVFTIETGQHTCETSASDVNVQHKIWRIAQLTNLLKINQLGGVCKYLKAIQLSYPFLVHKMISYIAVVCDENFVFSI